MDTRTILRAWPVAGLLAVSICFISRKPVEALQAPREASSSAEKTLEATALETTLFLSQMGETRLPSDIIRREMDGPRGAAMLREAERKAILPATRRAKTALTPAQSRAFTMRTARALIPLLENAFIRDPEYSTLDLLPPDERARFKAFAWHDDDYPGGPEGPNESVVMEMDAALSRVRPERRANSTGTAVVTQAQFDEAMWAYIQSRRRPVPGQEPRQLDKDALVSFRMMAEAAARDGVDLRIASSDRLPEVAARNAESTNNPFAVARFSSHILGLAMDLKLSDSHTKIDEVTTRPMANIITMRRTMAHKWMFLKGAKYGWYPYQHEPWHWEYNPPGFRERFWAPLGGPPKAAG